MEFLNKLVETKESERMKTFSSPFGSYEDMGFRMLKGVIINENVHLSIQASYGHYCNPRKTLPLDYYTSMELAVFKNGEFVNVNQVTNNNSLAQRLNEYYEGTVYGYVPVELIEELYQDLISL